MSLLIESIRLHDGHFSNLFYHEQRMAHALRLLFGVNEPVELETFLRMGTYPQQGLYKCRVIYDARSRQTEYVAYEAREIRKIKVIEDNEISYSFKYRNRDAINRVFDRRGKCDDVLIVKSGKVTDCSYSNIVFRMGNEWITPSTPLLEGTMRQQLIDDNKIQVREIEKRDIRSFASFKLINAMLGFDSPEIDVSNIVF